MQSLRLLVVFLRLKVKWFLLATLFQCCVVFAEPANKSNALVSLQSQFQPIVKTISKTLMANFERYTAEPQTFQGFLDQNVRPFWDPSSTAKALVGSANFRALNAKTQDRLTNAVERTLVRYAFEGVAFYNGQTFELVDVAISDSGKMGWVQVVMRSQILPDLNLDILVKRNKTGIWKAVDVRFKGVTYVAVKKHSFQKIMQKQGVDALIASLDVKNNKFFDALKTK
jgi:ABC-type transporter MlaC component